MKDSVVERPDDVECRRCARSVFFIATHHRHEAIELSIGIQTIFHLPTPCKRFRNRERKISDVLDVPEDVDIEELGLHAASFPQTFLRSSF